MDDNPQPPSAAEYRARSDRGRVEARSRYHDHLAAVLGQRGVEQATEVADVALDALTEWRYVDTGERCRCSCHPQLPDSDRHGYGFDCTCIRTREQRHASFQLALNEIREYWQSPEGQQRTAAHHAAQADLQDWLSRHPGVIVHSHGGWAPEQWRGEVDGHSFYFRERHDDWHIEIDLRPTGQFMDAIDGRNDDGTTRYRKKAFEQGDVVATGTIDAEGYGNTAVERAHFIVNTVRVHLVRRECPHPRAALDSVAAMFGTGARWCPACGTQLQDY